MCDPCGVECDFTPFRGLPPTAIRVLSLRDNRGQCADAPENNLGARMRLRGVVGFLR